MVDTPIDELIDYPMKVVQAIGNDKTITSLLTNNPDISMYSDEAYDIFGRYLFDYDYVDQTTVEASAYVCVEAEINKRTTATMHEVCLYITVYCHKKYMDLDPTKFPGIAGNRRDNIVRNICDLLNGETIYGVGSLELESVKTRTAPLGFTAREMTYSIPDFALN